MPQVGIELKNLIKEKLGLKYDTHNIKKFSKREGEKMNKNKYPEADPNEPRPAGAEVEQPKESGKSIKYPEPEERDKRPLGAIPIKNLVEDAGFELAQMKELFIIEEIKPFFEDKTLKQSLKVRLKSNRDAVDEYKAKVRKAIDKVNKMVEKPSEWKEDIIKFIKKELGLE